MEIADLVDKLTDAKADKVKLDGQIVSLTTDLTARDAKISQLEADLEAAKTASETVAAEKQAELNLALASLSELAKVALVAAGDTNPTVPEKVADLVEVIKTKSAQMSALLSAGSRKPTDYVPSRPAVSAFRTSN